MKKSTLLILAALLSVMFIFSGCDTASASATSDNDLATVSSAENSMLDTSELFTERDMSQSADTSEAEYIGLSSNKDVTIEKEGVYVISGNAENTTIVVDTDDEAKIQLVLDGVNIENEDAPAIYIKEADKVFITTTDSENTMIVTGQYEAEGDTNLDAVIYSKSDITLNGLGNLEIVSAYGNGIATKDDMKITGGTYSITALEDGLEANDTIRIADGDIAIDAGQDALHSENDDDDTLGYIYILDGTLNITAGDDAIRGTSILQIDGGTINVDTCIEGIEATYIQINGGEITIYSTDDAINATAKSSSYEVAIEVNDGAIDITMANGDTDAFDSNGDIYINGGNINVSASSSFDANGTSQLNGGTVTVNGQAVTEITSSQGRGGQSGRSKGR